jgi:hypothetical protein
MWLWHLDLRVLTTDQIFLGILDLFLVCFEISFSDRFFMMRVFRAQNIVNGETSLAIYSRKEYRLFLEDLIIWVLTDECTKALTMFSKQKIMNLFYFTYPGWLKLSTAW